MNEVNNLMDKVLTLCPKYKDDIDERRGLCLKAFHDDPNIETLKKCEEVLKIRLMNFIVGDISYNGPKEVDFSDTAGTTAVYNYVRYFFNIDLMIHNAAKSSDFWVHVLKLLTKDKDGKDGKSKNAK